MSVLYVFSDGGARGNPGPAGAGIVLLDEENRTIAALATPLGRMTNNQAEYWGVIFALEKVAEILEGGFEATEVQYALDSQLVVEQLAGNYKVKNEGLRPLHERVATLVSKLPIPVHFQHVPRRKNAKADRLANEAMDIVEGKQTSVVQ